MPSKQACYVSFNGQEIFKPSFEYLVGEGFEWVGSSSGHVPDNAVLSGNEQTGEPLYVGRAHHDGSLTPGKIHQSHQCIYIAYGGMEIAIRDYDVLIAPQRGDKLLAFLQLCSFLILIDYCFFSTMDCMYCSQ